MNYCPLDKNPNWKGGRFLHSKSGYIYIKAIDHPTANKSGYVSEHRLLCEKVIGRYLERKHPVHHHVGTIPTLVVCQDQGYHIILHRRTRAYLACGHATWRKCNICKDYDEPQNLYINGCHITHRECASRYYYSKKLKNLEG